MTKQQPPRQLPLRRKLLFTAFCLVLFFVGGELMLRVIKGELFSTYDVRHMNARLAELADDPMPSHEYHPTLGFVPVANFDDTVQHAAVMVKVTCDDQSFRISENEWGDQEPRIIMLGDSYTFGAEVDNHETYPAYFERVINEPVINAGVQGFGMDQMILQLEELLENPDVARPEIVILTIIPDNVNRCGLRIREAHKPYFDVVDGKLKLRQVPVPKRSNSEPFYKPVLGRSHLVHSIMKRAAPYWWAPGRYVREHDDYVQVCELLLVRFKELSEKYEFTPKFVVLGTNAPWFHREHVVPLFRKAIELEIDFIDLQLKMFRMYEEDKAAYRKLFRLWHCSPEGNEWIAQQVAAEWFVDGDESTTDTITN
jgi:hypothetical protein